MQMTRAASITSVTRAAPIRTVTVISASLRVRIAEGAPIAGRDVSRPTSSGRYCSGARDGNALPWKRNTDRNAESAGTAISEAAVGEHADAVADLARLAAQAGRDRHSTSCTVPAEWLCTIILDMPSPVHALLK